jgi:hypothetical protein
MSVPPRPRTGLGLTGSRLLKLVTFALMGAAIIAALVVLVRGGLDLARQSIRVNVPLLLLSFLVQCSGLLITIPIWRQMLLSFDCHTTARHHTRIYCYSMLGVILPGGIWPMASRSILYKRLGVDSVMVAAASVVEALVIGIASMAVYATYLIIDPGTGLLRRPEIGIGIALLALLLLYPPIFDRLANQALKWRRAGENASVVHFRARQLLFWLLLEAVVVVIGGVALFVLLSSMMAVPVAALTKLVGAWAATVAVGNLFFWLPATSLLRDGVLVFALAAIIGLPVAVLFAVLARVWSVASMLLLAGVIWLALDYVYVLLRPH